MDEAVKAARRAKAREHANKLYSENAGYREKTKQRRREYIQHLKDEGKYEEFKEKKNASERKRVNFDPEYHRMRCAERNARWRGKHWEKIMVRNARSRSLKKGLPFDISRNDVVVPDVCPVLGTKLEKAFGNLSDNSPSLDRIRPELGYVKGNIRVISQRANRLKCDATAAELKLVYEDLLRIEAT